MLASPCVAFLTAVRPVQNIQLTETRVLSGETTKQYSASSLVNFEYEVTIASNRAWAIRLEVYLFPDGLRTFGACFIFVPTYFLSPLASQLKCRVPGACLQKRCQHLL